MHIMSTQQLTVSNSNKPSTNFTELYNLVKSLSILDQDNEVNLTPIAKLFGKRIDTWKKKEAEILDEIRITLETETEILRIKRSFEGEQGTFTNNPDVLLEFLRYCSPKLAVKMTKVVSQLFSTGKVELQPTTTYRNSTTMTTKDWIKFSLELEERKELLQEELLKTKLELDHKKEVVIERASIVPLKETRAKIAKIIQYVIDDDGKQVKVNPKLMSSRYNLLYNEFATIGEIGKRINLRTKTKNYNDKYYGNNPNKAISILEYAELFGYIDALYNLALKLFEVNTAVSTRLLLQEHHYCY